MNLISLFDLNLDCLFQDKETRDFIYEFIERHGGVDAALMEEDGRFGQVSHQPGAALSAGIESIQFCHGCNKLKIEKFHVHSQASGTDCAQK